MKKETRGRKSKLHAPIKASFNEVLGAIGKSKYRDEKAISKKNKKRA